MYLESTSFHSKNYKASKKDILKAREFVKKVKDLASSYFPNMNYFFLTDGASTIHNNGNPAIKCCREALIKYEKSNGFNPKEDWSSNPSDLSDYYNESSYDPPMDFDSLPSHLKRDKIHAFRAKNGIELIHKEPTYEEFKRICRNWKLMPDDLKKKSDEFSLKVFGMTNLEHMKELEKEYNK